MLAGKKNELTLRVLEKMRRQGAPKRVELISGMTKEGEDLGSENMSEMVESKSSLLSGSSKKKKRSAPSEA